MASLTLSIYVTDITRGEDGIWTATYSKNNSGSNGHATVDPDTGLIDLRASHIGDTYTLQFILPEGYRFNDTASNPPAIKIDPVDADSNTFTNYTSGQNIASVDDNNDPEQWEYTLSFADSEGNPISLDPRVVNR